MTIALVTIGYSDHDYIATVNTLKQIENYLSLEKRSFKIVNVDVIDTSYNQALAQVMTRIGRYANCKL